VSFEEGIDHRAREQEQRPNQPNRLHLFLPLPEQPGDRPILAFKARVDKK
jgi:hypothetical protein